METVLLEPERRIVLLYLKVKTASGNNSEEKKFFGPFLPL
jgi:hypothetical protein